MLATSLGKTAPECTTRISYLLERRKTFYPMLTRKCPCLELAILPLACNQVFGGGQTENALGGLLKSLVEANYLGFSVASN